MSDLLPLNRVMIHFRPYWVLGPDEAVEDDDLSEMRGEYDSVGFYGPEGETLRVELPRELIEEILSHFIAARPNPGDLLLGLDTRQIQTKRDVFAWLPIPFPADRQETGS